MTPEQREVVGAAFASVNKTVSRYGGRPLPLDTSHLHLVMRSDLPDDERTEFAGTSGLYNSNSQEMFVLFSEEDANSKPKLLRRVVHESLHFNSFQSISVSADRVIRPRHEGMMLMQKDGYIGSWLDEAITERMTMSIVEDRLANDENFRDDFTRRQELMASAIIDSARE